MENVFLSLFLLFVLFDNAIFNILSINGSGWTVIFTISLLMIFVIFMLFLPDRLKVTKLDLKVMILTTIIIIVGLLGNYFFNYTNSIQFIITDVIDFIKFPFCFIAIRSLNIDRSLAKSFINFGQYLVKIMIAIVFICGIISQFKDIGMTPNTRVWFGIHAYSFLFPHPTYFVLSCIFMLSLITSVNVKHLNIYVFILLISTLLGLRTKGAVIVVVFIVLKYCKNFFRQHRFFSWLGVFFATLIVGWSKLHEYLSYTGSAREAAYVNAWDILKKHFPIGSGFSTYASFLSGKAHSALYIDYPIPEGFDMYGLPTALLGDTGYPYYIAQFGIIGFLLFIVLLIDIYRILTQKKFALSSLVIFFYVVFALGSESSLLNFGVETAVILATVNYIENNYLVDDGVDKDE